MPVEIEAGVTYNCIGLQWGYALALSFLGKVASPRGGLFAVCDTDGIWESSIWRALSPTVYRRPSITSSSAEPGANRFRRPFRNCGLCSSLLLVQQEYPNAKQTTQATR